MKIRLGALEIVLDVDQPTGDVLDLTIRDILNSNITVNAKQDLSYVPRGTAKKLDFHHEEEEEEEVGGYGAKSEGHDPDLHLLHEVGLTKKTLSMISGKVLGIKATGSSFYLHFPTIKEKSLEFLNRSIKEEIWAIFVKRIHFANETRVAVLGLNSGNSITILALESSKSIKDIYQKLLRRGLRAKSVKIGVLSVHLSPNQNKEFKEAFPNSKIGLDWQEYISIQTGDEVKEKLAQAMKSGDPGVVSKAVSQTKAPKELLTFLEFPKKLWRPLKNTGAVTRLEKDLKSKMKSKAITNEDQRELVFIWSIIRLQYQWLKIPVDANQLSNLSQLGYLREQAET